LTSEHRPAVVAFAAPSGSGKTTLLVKVLAHLKAAGHHVGAVKSDAHRVELDKPGKDTHRMRDAGAEVTGLVSRDQIAIFRDAPGPELRLAHMIEVFFAHLDLVLAEGFRSQGYPTIVVCREGIDMKGWEWPSNVVAIVSDTPTDKAHPTFALNDIAGIAAFVQDLARPEEA